MLSVSKGENPLTSLQNPIVPEYYQAQLFIGLFVVKLLSQTLHKHPSIDNHNINACTIFLITINYLYKLTEDFYFKGWWWKINIRPTNVSNASEGGRTQGVNKRTVSQNTFHGTLKYCNGTGLRDSQKT